MVSHRSPGRLTPPRHPLGPPGTGWPARVTVLTAAASAVAMLTVGTAGADPDDGAAASGGPAASAASVGARVDRLYTEAERATERYNGAVEREAGNRARLSRVQERAARGQERVNRLRGELGALAGAQYRSGGLDPSLALLLSPDPDAALERAAAFDRIGSTQQAKLRRLESAQRVVEQAREEGTRRLEQLERQRTALREHKKAVRQKLGTARRLLDRLSPREQADLERGPGGAGADGPSAASGMPAGERGGPGAPSSRAAAAVAAARCALGSPYVWGQAGPRSFDCSGLTQWAYGQAGVSLPRTSQAQAAAGQRVPLSAVRPGDLVTYRDDASHVAMYVGDGQVVHAPRPGAQVRYDPVAMMPVSAVTRP